MRLYIKPSWRDANARSLSAKTADVLAILQIRIVPLFVSVRTAAIHMPRKPKKETQGEEGDSESEDSDGADGDAVTDEELSETELE